MEICYLGSSLTKRSSFLSIPASHFTQHTQQSTEASTDKCTLQVSTLGTLCWQWQRWLYACIGITASHLLAPSCAKNTHVGLQCQHEETLS